ncbi:hypothetical protein BJN45_09910 [Azonexus hydrophilus]|uniref:SPOR domain-containing protein n=1 Tax=Azonexus hydrophilus TaxID=418702 RepID=A0A1R1I4S3_9RHOO|nr:SPOR domain-containing protein [Azonexus hydrophilus]OMG53736.1 hypothetical protein BJN45_09910 [Azonexus hydrophilus]
MEDNDAQLQLKKRARRRLVGAVFFVSLVALVLPMLMDHDPRPPVQDVEIRIPGQDEKSFAPAMVAVPQESAPEKAPVAPPPVPQKPVEPPPVVEKPVIKAPEKTAEKVPEKAPEKPAKPVEKKPEPAKPVVSDEARRAAAILAGQSATPPAATGGAHVILIGAFSNEANVVNLRKKLGEQGIKTFTEPLASPQGTKTRVRAGPFPSREAADKALDKMKRIGVSGVVTPKP